jgi:hypothetical protein
VYAFKGAWQRTEAIVDGHPLDLVSINRCDERVTLTLNPERRLFGIQPMSSVQTMIMVKSAAGTPTSTALTTMSEDVQDTGERRAVGPFTARHVITTEETRSVVAGQEYVSRQERDGWYVDVPLGCFDPLELNSRRDVSGVQVVKTGSGRRGLAIEEVWRQSDRSGNRADLPTIRTTTSVVSERILDPLLFEVPAGYKAAVRMPGYGYYDMRRPDTWLNRLSAYWEATTLWMSSLMRSF